MCAPNKYSDLYSNEDFWVATTVLYLLEPEKLYNNNFTFLFIFYFIHVPRLALPRGPLSPEGTILEVRNGQLFNLHKLKLSVGG